MKTILPALVLVLLLADACAADSVRFSEVLRDVNVCTRDPDTGERYCETEQRNSGLFIARVTMPGLGAVPTADETTLEVSLGGFQFSDQLVNANSRTAGRATFRLLEFDDLDRPHLLGSVTFSRAGDVLNVSASFSRLPSSLVADSGAWDENGNGTVDFTATIGDVSYSRTVYYKAKTVAHQPADPLADPLFTITVAGSADFTPPQVSITAPKNKARLTNEVVMFRGKSKDNLGVSEVQYRTGTNDWTTADGTLNWKADVLLEFGTNVVQVKSIDYEGLESKPATCMIIRRP